MITALKKSKSLYDSSASVVDGKLILSFPGAKTPVVWQMDLTEAKASALEVQGQKDPFTLVLKTAKGEAMDIAPFSTKEEAVEGLVAVTRALQNAHGLIRPGVAGDSQAVSGIPQIAKKGKSRWWLLGVIFLGLVGLWIGLGALRGPGAGVSSDAALDGEAAPGQTQNGVPMSADEFLNNNR